MIDPPWQQAKGGKRTVRPNQTKALDYKTMNTKDIFKLLDKDIFIKCSTNHIVFMWTIEKFLTDCDNEMLSRNYKRHVRMIWDKGNGVCPAFTIRYSHEYMIWYYKNKLIPINKDYRGKYTSIFKGTPREHSRKPESAYKIIESLYSPINYKCIDVFSRESRKHWEQYGDQLDKFNK
jgi:N6-adenosine-specific RNA methylase IME4